MRRAPVRLGILGITIGLIGLGLGLSGCGRDGAAEIPSPGETGRPWLADAGEGGPWNVLLITLDTTRRDRFGCYGGSSSVTPNLDRLAERGTLFENAISPVPVTLPAHATLLTGLDPQEHGVRNNGTYVLDSARVTLAEVLRSHGYATGATLGAFPVDARFGLNQGFDAYDDDFPAESRRREWQTAQRRAAQVSRAALAWIGAHRDRPFFHWAHYFDPHFPYEPPEPFAGKFPQPYDGEVAYVDAAVGQLLRGLDSLGVRRTTWILCVADHGEALGEHGENGHSMLVYAATQCVPCLLIPPEAGRGRAAESLRGRRVPEAIGLRDLAPTLVNALGLGRTELPASGVSLLPWLVEGTRIPNVTYTETLVPFLEYGWSELRGVRTSRWSYVRAPRPELYDLVKDPGEATNLSAREPEIAARLSAWCDRFAGAEGAGSVTQDLDPETIERLRSLGYVATAAPHGPSRNEKDPKTLMPLFEKINAARTAIASQSLEEARRLAEEVLASDPGNPQATRLLGTARLQLGDWAGARRSFDDLLARFPGDFDAAVQGALARLWAGDLEPAERSLADLHRRYPKDGQVRDLYAGLLARRGRAAEGRRLLEAALASSDAGADAWVHLARFEWNQGNVGEARRAAREALARDSTQATALAIEGESTWQSATEVGEPEAGRLRVEAQARMERALALDATEPIAAFRLGWIARQAGDPTRALELYQRALSRQPDAAPTHVNLANLLREMERPMDALRHYAIARSLGLDDVNLLVNYGVTLATVGRIPEARQIWEDALAKTTDPQMREGLQRNLQRLQSAGDR
jgi:arylsulfatase A-like enzyme/tetratricopeptide (TPR) repeat protein